MAQITRFGSLAPSAARVIGLPSAVSTRWPSATRLSARKARGGGVLVAEQDRAGAWCLGAGAPAMAAGPRGRYGRAMTETATTPSELARAAFRGVFDERDLDHPERFWSDRSTNHFLATGETVRGRAELVGWF